MDSILENVDQMLDDLTQMFVIIYKNENVEVVQNWIKSCDKVLKTLKKLLNHRNLSATTKRKIHNKITNLKTKRALVLYRTEIHGAGHSTTVQWSDSESAFSNRLSTGVIENLIPQDLFNFLEAARSVVIEKVNQMIKNYYHVKVNSILTATFVLKDNTEVKYFHSKSVALQLTSNFNEWYADHILKPCANAIEEFQERDSGWALVGIQSLMLNINKYSPLIGSSYLDLPRDIQLKKAVLNVRNEHDNFCFAWACLSALYPVSNHHAQNVRNYRRLFHKLDFTGISFPVSIKDIPKFERLNKIRIHVYVLEKRESTHTVLPLYISQYTDGNVKCIHLLWLNEQIKKNGEITTKAHFCWIKNLSRLVSCQVSKHHGKIYVCDKCLHYFQTLSKLQTHELDCSDNRPCKITLPEKSNNILKFKNVQNQVKVPFIVYADFECLLSDITEDSIESTSGYQKHTPYSVGLYFKCTHDESKSFYSSHRGLDCEMWFVNALHDIAFDVANYLEQLMPMLPLTCEQQNDFDTATLCWICELKFEDFDTRVKDHCHLTGEYRGAAHQTCNLDLKSSRTIPVVLHNLSGYDAHFIIKKLATHRPGRVTLLPINKERYISFTKYMASIRMKLRFIDSFRHLNSSLSELASYMSPDNMTNLRSQFPNLSQSKFKLLTRKGIFPYDYVSSIDTLLDTALPSKNDFYNTLNDTDISDEDYRFASEIWESFDIKSLGEYSDLYLKVDVLLLADVFENFRNSCHEKYKLDPAHYCTLPGFTWDCMLKHTKINLELLVDVDMLLFVERGLRGGLSQCSNRYAKANNKFMDNYDLSIESSYLMNFDVNNLYGWAMCQYIPYGGFEWMENCEIFDVTLISSESNIGYILEVDLEYPPELHVKHQDLPFCCNHSVPPGGKHSKLLATVEHKNRYVIYYRNLQQCLEQGLVLTKIHRILQFQQSPWLKPYIDFNTKLRAASKNKFEQNLYKLMNNAVFGKTMENVRNYRDVKLVTKWKGRYGAEALISKPNFHSRSIFAEDLVAVELKKLEIVFNKPVYAGMVILDISKICVYRFHYAFMLKNFESKCKLMYTDTDSLLYEIKCEDVYDVIRNNIEMFDTSDYSPDNVHNIPLVNKKVVGLMKDENQGEIMTEFVGLRSKLYAIRMWDNRVTKKAKGVKFNVTKNQITFEDYLQCLTTSSQISRTQKSIKSILHNVYSTTQFKIALSDSDDKRCLISGSTDTLPWGHKNIPSQNE